MKYFPLLALSLALGLYLSAPFTAHAAYGLLNSIPAPSGSAEAGANMGYSVAVAGNYVAVGAPLDDSGAVNSGIVRVFNADKGTLLWTLAEPSPGADHGYGYSVAISGTRVVVGAPGVNTSSSYAGTAYVYDLSGANPTIPIQTLNNPTPAKYDLYGYSVSISGDRVAIGAMRDDTVFVDAGAVYIYDLTTGTPSTPVRTLFNPGPASDYFGCAVSISGTRVVAGAYRTDVTGINDAGAAYVYDLASGTPTTPIAVLLDPTPADGDKFGLSVSISGSKVVVGAYQDDTGAGNAGSIYVYDMDSGTPTTPLTINNPSPASQDIFGFNVSISGNLVVAGAHQDDTGATDAGTAYVFDLTSLTPEVPVRAINNPAPGNADHFGFAVAISGNRVAVGAPMDEAGAADAGSAYAYDLSSASPTLPTAVLSPAGAIHFGSSIAMSDAFAVVGAPHDNTAGSDSGAVYVYDRSNILTAPVLILTNPTPAAMDGFGSAIALSGGYLVVGAQGDDTGAADAGSVYVYDLNSATPTQPLLTLNNPNPAASDAFGAAVVISGSRIAVGAYLDDAGAVNAGSVYVYDLSSGVPTVPVATILNPAPAADDFFGISVALSGSRLVVGASGDDATGTDTGTAYVFDLSGGPPAAPAFTFANPSPAANDAFGASVAISGARVVVGAPGDDTGATNAGAAYVYDLSGGTPTTPVNTLTNPTAAAGDGFGSLVSISGSRVAVAAPYDDFGTLDSGVVHVYELVSATPAVPTDSLINPAPNAHDTFGFSLAFAGADIAIGAPADDTVAPDQGYGYIYGVPAAGVIAIGGTVFLANEGDGVVTIPLLRGNGTGGTVSVDVTTTDGTAKAGKNFTALAPSPKTVTFADGVTEVQVPITLIASGAVAPNQSFNVTISNPTGGATLGAVVTARVVILDAAPDTTKPTVTLTSPSANARISDAAGATVMVTGKAADGRGVAKVQVRINGGSFEDALIPDNVVSSPQVTFSHPVSPVVGLNTLQVRSLDDAGNVSTLASRTFVFFSLRDLVVAVEGPASSGSVSNGFLGASSREVGVSYSITATAKRTPAPGFMFAGWAVGGGPTLEQIGVTEAMLNSPMLKFTFRQGLMLTAKFVPYPFTADVVGNFNGLILPSAGLPAPNGTTASHETVGMISATVSTGGAVSGKVFMDGLTITFVGDADKDGAVRFGPSHSPALFIDRVTKPSFQLALAVDLNPAGTGKMTGTLTQSYRAAVRSVSLVDADRAYYGGVGPKVPENLAGTGARAYTALFPPRDSQPAPLTTADYPQGHGFGNVTVKTNGLVSIAGKLADGTTLTASAPLSKANTWPLFQQLYKLGAAGRGCIAGTITVNDALADTDMLGSKLYWFRPFQLVQWYPYGWDEGIFVDFMAAKYDVPAAASVFPGLAVINAASGNAEITFTGGLLDDDLTLPVNISSANTVTKPSANTDGKFAMKIAAPTGLISGAFTDSEGNKPSFGGIIYQKGINAGAYGYFLSAPVKEPDYLGQSGNFELLAK